MGRSAGLGSAAGAAVLPTGFWTRSLRDKGKRLVDASPLLGIMQTTCRNAANRGTPRRTKPGPRRAARARLAWVSLWIVGQAPRLPRAHAIKRQAGRLPYNPEAYPIEQRFGLRRTPVAGLPRSADAARQGGPGCQVVLSPARSTAPRVIVGRGLGVDQHLVAGTDCHRKFEGFVPPSPRRLRQADCKFPPEDAKLANASKRNRAASEGASSGNKCPTSGTDLSRASVPWMRARISRVTRSPVIA